jgi:prolyl oligopeptidase
VFYASKDGTQIPMFITHKKGIKLDGTNPTLLYGYGGFNISMTPSFAISRVLWIENGGVYAVACLRGGNEYGEEWHQQGVLDRKQNVFDDFIAAAEYLIKEKYRRRSCLPLAGATAELLTAACTVRRRDIRRGRVPGARDRHAALQFTVGVQVSGAAAGELEGLRVHDQVLAASQRQARLRSVRRS